MELAQQGRPHRVAGAILGPPEARFATAVLLVLALAALVADRRLGPPPEPYPTSDYAVLELCVRLAAEGSQRLGPEARFHFQHPGPAFFYMAVPFYEALGRDGAALGAAALFWNLLALLAFVRGSSRLLPQTGGPLAAALALAFLARRGLGFLLSFWNANLPILPFAAALVASGRLAAGDVRALPVLALFGSLAVQTHAVYLVPLTLVASAGLALFARKRWRASARPADPGTSPALVATTVVLALLWALPFWDELSGDYHNLRRLLGTGGQPRANPWMPALAGAARALLGFAGVSWDGGSTPLWSASSLFALALLAAFAWASRDALHRQGHAAALAAVSGASLLSVVLTARVAPGALQFPYVLHWAAFAGAATALLVAAQLLERAPRVRRLVVGLPGRLLLCAAAALLLLVQARAERVRAQQPRAGASLRVEQAEREIVTGLERATHGMPVAARPPFLLHVGGGADRDAALGLILALDKAGQHFAVAPFGAYRLDGRLKPRGHERGELWLGSAPGQALGAARRLSSVPGLEALWTSSGPASPSAP